MCPRLLLLIFIKPIYQSANFYCNKKVFSANSNEKYSHVERMSIHAIKKQQALFFSCFVYINIPTNTFICSRTNVLLTEQIQHAYQCKSVISQSVAIYHTSTYTYTYTQPKLNFKLNRDKFVKAKMLLMKTAGKTVASKFEQLVWF